MGALAAVAGTAVLAAVAVLYLPPSGSFPLLLASLWPGPSLWAPSGAG